MYFENFMCYITDTGNLVVALDKESALNLLGNMTVNIINSFPVKQRTSFTVSKKELLIFLEKFPGSRFNIGGLANGNFRLNTSFSNLIIAFELVVPGIFLIEGGSYGK